MLMLIFFCSSGFPFYSLMVSFDVHKFFISMKSNFPVFFLVFSMFCLGNNCLPEDHENSFFFLISLEVLSFNFYTQFYDPSYIILIFEGYFCLLGILRYLFSLAYRNCPIFCCFHHLRWEVLLFFYWVLPKCSMYLFIYLAILHGMQDLSYLTRDRTCIPEVESES